MALDDSFWAMPVLEAIGGFLALLTARRAASDHRLTRAWPLRVFSAGFFLLAVAQGAALVLELLTARASQIPSGGPDRYDGLFVLYYGGLLAGFAFIFSSFGRRPFQWAAATAPFLLVGGLLAQFATLLLLFFIVLHAGLNHIARARPGSLQTASGFFLLLLGHFLFLFDYHPLTPRNLWGELASVAGYLLLFLAVDRPRRTE